MSFPVFIDECPIKSFHVFHGDCPPLELCQDSLFSAGCRPVTLFWGICRALVNSPACWFFRGALHLWVYKCIYITFYTFTCIYTLNIVLIITTYCPGTALSSNVLDLLRFCTISL